MDKKQPSKRPARRRKNISKAPEIQGINIDPRTIVVDEVKEPVKPQCLCCPDCWNVPCDACQTGDVCQMIPCACGTIYAKK